ncbi:hypothetical protein [Streptomyces sp. NPDC002133]|uniref:hypothetical protein n=1 Tax=Streptomyces sp. NPDC002133 TaxID=3154409 RepID=UPI00331D9C45
MPPLRSLPEASSYAVMPGIATAKTTTAAGTDRFRSRTRVQYVVASPNSPAGDAS